LTGERLYRDYGQSATTSGELRQAQVAREVILSVVLSTPRSC